MRRIPVILVALLVTVGWGRTVSAHQASVSYSDVSITDDGTVDYRLRLSSRDLYEALHLDRDRDATDDEIHAGEDSLFTYVLERLHIAGGAGACPVERHGLAVLHQNDRFVELRFVARCTPPIGNLAIDYELFFDLDPRHTGMLEAHHGVRTIDQEFTKSVRQFSWDLDLATPASLGLVDYLGKGIEHIYTGYDHIAFIVGLLLIAAVKPGPRGWEARGLRAAIPYTVKIVTAFTLAHSCTLILAALDVVSLPSRFVESSIAASIVYVALENIWLGDPRHRWPLAFAFGLVHGLGFASMLRPILPQSGVIVPLLAFNLGVEVGQLSIVAALLPILHLVARRDANAYRRWVVIGGSSLVGLFGLIWLVERIFDVKLISTWLGT